MNTNQLNQQQVLQKNSFKYVQSWLARLQQKLTVQQRNQQMRAAARASYAVWVERYGERGQMLLCESDLQTQILPQLFARVAEMTEPSPTDAATALATELRGCADGQCSSFANFTPELANYVCLFEKRLGESTRKPHALVGLAQAA